MMTLVSYLWLELLETYIFVLGLLYIIVFDQKHRTSHYQLITLIVKTLEFSDMN